MKSQLLLLALVAVTSATQAATFSFDTTGSEPLYQTTLTKAVYQYTTSGHLNELAITNADGESIPYALAPYEQVYLETNTTNKSKPLVIFPIREDTAKQHDNMTIQLNNHEDQTNINVITEGNNTTTNTSYLFDLGKKHPAFKKLTLDWQGQEGSLFTVNLLASNNLKNWSTVGQAALLKTANDDQEILQNTITVDSTIKQRYLKIQPQEINDAFELTSVNIAFNQIKEQAAPLIWQTIPFSERDQKDKAQTYIDFESLSHYPAELLKINLPQQNTITQVSILTRNNKNDAWRTITNTALYRVNKNGKEFTNKVIKIPRTTARYWRLRFNQTNGGIGKKNPELSLGWSPKIIVWNARGSGPFNLHIGDPSQTANSIPMAQLQKPYGAKRIKNLPVVNLHLTSSEQPTNTWHSSTDYKRFWLWGGLLIGVIALGVMAYSLLKNNPPNRPIK